MDSFFETIKLLETGGVFKWICAQLSDTPVTALALPEHTYLLANLLPGIDIRSHPEREGGLVIDCQPLAYPSTSNNVLSLFTDVLACFLASVKIAPRPAAIGPRYYIVSTPRSGSTFLSDLLCSTQQLGTPTEHLKPWLAYYLKVSGISFPRLLEALHRYSASENGVFGSKIIIDDLFEFFREFREDVLEELRDARVFFLLRGDKEAQAISNVRSNRLAVYHVYEGDTASKQLSNVSLQAGLDEIFLKERWLLRQEADLLNLFADNNIKPKLISYEACVQSRRTAELVVDEIAASIPVALKNSFSWPQLVRIGTLVNPEPLIAYRNFRVQTTLYSARSEPWIGMILGGGWNIPRPWGVHKGPGRAELKLRHCRPVHFIEILFCLSPDAPRRITVGTDTLDVERPQSNFEPWVWVGAIDETIFNDGVIEVSFDEGTVVVDEVVYYTQLPYSGLNFSDDQRAVLFRR